MKMNPWIIGIIAVVVALLGWSWFARSSEPKPEPVTVADPSTLPGIRTNQAPWPIELSGLTGRLAADGLPALKEEGQVMHIHQHLDIVVHGQAVTVPPNIGIGPAFISPIHTHDERGVIHVESPFTSSFTLGQFFDIWGVLFTKDCIGGYCADGANALEVYVNGERYEGDPRGLVLASRQQIAVVYGTETERPAEIPATYGFKPGE